MKEKDKRTLGFIIVSTICPLLALLVFILAAITNTLDNWDNLIWVFPLFGVWLLLMGGIQCWIPEAAVNDM